ncbi:hypothetical protein BaRGS_00018106 [Batillaria attramentaria]|uniref:Uncharacterized protein n=1 Tax=Batillaria attramentaria TaxID=370345 RepID=A0ABD0KUW9_9CAEN
MKRRSPYNLHGNVVIATGTVMAERSSSCLKLQTQEKDVCCRVYDFIRQHRDINDPGDSGSVNGLVHRPSIRKCMRVEKLQDPLLPSGAVLTSVKP